MHRLARAVTRFRGYTPIVDGNIVEVGLLNGDSLCSFLNDAMPYKIQVVNEEVVNRAERYFDLASDFISKSKPLVIGEVIQELATLERSLNRIKSFYKRKIDENKGDWRTSNGFGHTGLKNLERIALRSSFFVNHMTLFMEDVNWRDTYLSNFLALARLHATDLNQGKPKKYSENNIGSFLETDLKLVTYCIYMANKNKMVLVTRDKGITPLFEGVRDLFGNNNLIPGNVFPLKNIILYNPDNGQEHFFPGT